MAKSVIEQLKEMDADLAAKIDAVVAKHPKLAVDDRQMTELFSIYLGADDSSASAASTTTETPAATTTSTATHTAALPSSATTTAAPAVTTTSSTNDSSAILAALNGLKSSIDERFKNVVTMDKVNELGSGLVKQAATQALLQADEMYTIRDTHQREFGEPFDKEAFKKFVLDSEDPVTKRNKYASLTDAYNAMVGQKRVQAEIKKGVDEGVKQKLSGATVPGQTTSTALSPAQQVMAKAKKDQAAEGGSRLNSLIERASAIERARESGAVN